MWLLCARRHNTSFLHVVPSNLDQLAEVVNLLRRMQEERPSIKGRFAPLNDKFDMLAKVGRAGACCHVVQSPAAFR